MSLYYGKPCLCFSLCWPSVSHRNWCAHVHSRLLPTVVVDNLETLSSGRAKPCTWHIGSCAQRCVKEGRESTQIITRCVINTTVTWENENRMEQISMCPGLIFMCVFTASVKAHDLACLYFGISVHFKTVHCLFPLLEYCKKRCTCTML